ncbi:MAG: sensor histidine kinase [Bacteroidota bacterium]
MNPWLILCASLGYLGLLFGVAYYSEQREKKGKSLIRNPLAYALSLAVYCTAWTFYGSVGRAATSGVEFLPVYLGPTLMAPLWYVVLRKIIVITRSQRINSIADFLSARYGKSAFLGGLVTFIAIIGIVPYIALQLKAVSFSFDLLAGENMGGVYFQKQHFYTDTSFYVTIILAIFTIFFGTRHLEASEHHEGLVAAIAFESIVKLLAFLTVGLFVVFFLYDGPRDLFSQALQQPNIIRPFEGLDEQNFDAWRWFWLTMISMFAITLLPRQFHIAVVENTDLQHVKKAIWLFPLYLFLINLFVIPIAVAGLLAFPHDIQIADTFVLRLPLAHGHNWMALIVFLGGLSASTSMVIVATIALSIMASNNLVVPLLLRTSVIRETFVQDLSSRLKGIRRLIIIVILMLAYSYFNWLGKTTSLVSIGLISFCAVAQFAPSLLGGLFWEVGNRKGAISGLLIGFIVWAFTLPLPSLLPEGHRILVEGLWGMEGLRPYALFGLDGFDAISHSAFWSLLMNGGTYLFVSLYTQSSAVEHSQANLFVHIYRYESNLREMPRQRTRAFLKDLQMLLNRFLGEDRAAESLSGYAREKSLDLSQLAEVGPDFVHHVENQIAGAIGAASARLLINSIVTEEPLGLQEVMEALDETQQIIQYSREIEKKSLELEKTGKKLQQANDRLREVDRLKDDFIATVTHELRTPITSIRAISNILYDNKNLPQAQRQDFLGIIIEESERISRLINQVLDLEKMESGHAEWNLGEVNFVAIVQSAAKGVQQLCADKGITLHENYPMEPLTIYGDKDRITQVVVNLLSNAIKFCNQSAGEIWLEVEKKEGKAILRVKDNGEGIPKENQPYIFDKFSQFTDMKTGRSQGSGLGLSITWRIVHHHRGHIRVESEAGKGAMFVVTLPVNLDKIQDKEAIISRSYGLD